MPGSLISQKNIAYMFVCNGTSDLYNTPGTDVNSLGADRTAVINTDGKTLTWNNTTKKWNDGSAVEYNKVRVAVNTNGNIYISPDILWDKVISRKYNDYSAPTEQIDYIGFNGTTGSIDVSLASTNYIIRLELIENQKQFGSKSMWKIAEYESPATGYSQEDTAAGLVKVLIGNFKREPEQRIKFERVANGTYGAADTGWTVTNKSKTIYKSSHGLTPATGSILRVTSSGAPGATDATYLVTGYTTHTISLDVEFQGSTSASGQIAANTVAPTAWGIKFTGVALDFKSGVQNYEKSRWKLNLNNEFGATTLTNSQAMSYGIGSYYEVAELEWFLEGNQTRGIRHRLPPYESRKDVVTNGTYDLVSISWTDNFTSPVIGQPALSFKELILAINSGTTDTIYKQAFNV